MGEQKAELCDNCGKVASNGVPCYLMFREKTDIQTCGGHLADADAHAKIVAQHNKVAKADAKGGGK